MFPTLCLFDALWYSVIAISIQVCQQVPRSPISLHGCAMNPMEPPVYIGICSLAQDAHKSQVVLGIAVTALSCASIPIKTAGRVLWSGPIAGCVKRAQIALRSAASQFGRSHKEFVSLAALPTASPGHPIHGISMTGLGRLLKVFARTIVYAVRCAHVPQNQKTETCLRIQIALIKQGLPNLLNCTPAVTIPCEQTLT